MAIDAPDPDDDDSGPDIDEVDATDAAAMKLRDCEADSAADQWVQDQADQRAWLKCCLEVIAARHQEPDRSPYVEQALAQLMVDAAERAGRILRADVGPGRD